MPFSPTEALDAHFDRLCKQVDVVLMNAIPSIDLWIVGSASWGSTREFQSEYPTPLECERLERAYLKAGWTAFKVNTGGFWYGYLNEAKCSEEQVASFHERIARWN